jgi:hypothetical protein
MAQSRFPLGANAKAHGPRRCELRKPGYPSPRTISPCGHVARSCCRRSIPRKACQWPRRRQVLSDAAPIELMSASRADTSRLRFPQPGAARVLCWKGINVFRLPSSRRVSSRNPSGAYLRALDDPELLRCMRGGARQRATHDEFGLPALQLEECLTRIYKYRTLPDLCVG